MVDAVTQEINASINDTFFSCETTEKNIVTHLISCIEQDCDMDNRLALRQAVVVSGGTSLVPFFESNLIE